MHENLWENGQILAVNDKLREPWSQADFSTLSEDLVDKVARDAFIVLDRKWRNPLGINVKAVPIR